MGHFYIFTKFQGFYIFWWCVITNNEFLSFYLYASLAELLFKTSAPGCYLLLAATPTRFQIIDESYMLHLWKVLFNYI